MTHVSVYLDLFIFVLMNILLISGDIDLNIIFC